MTMPHLMNCSHMGDGWCLDCVKELWEEKCGWEDSADRLAMELAKLENEFAQEKIIHEGVAKSAEAIINMLRKR